MNISFLDSATLGDTDLSPLQQFGPLTTHPTSTPEEVITRITDAECVISNKAIISAEAIKNAPNLKLILSAATGVNQIDLQAAKQNNITVCNVAGYSTHSVAQHVFTLILNLATAIHHYHNEQHLWPKSEIFTRLDYPTFNLAGKTLGIIGLGSIGKTVAKIAQAFDMNVIALESSSSKITSDIPRLPLNQLLATSDIITLHCPLTEKTKHLINQQTLSLMKPSALLINTGRGPLINEEDLALALKNNTIAGSGLDVLSTEPPAPNNPLITSTHPNLIITPHTAWATTESRKNLLQGLVKNIKNYLAGTPSNQLV